MAPLMQTLSLAPTESDHLCIQLSAHGMLAWPKWNKPQEEFIRSFEGGPPLREICIGHTDDPSMQSHQLADTPLGVS